MTTNNYLSYIPKRVQLNPTLRCISGFFLKTNTLINNFPKWAMHKYYNEKYANQRNVSKNSLGKIRIEQSTLISGCLNCLIKMK